MFKDAACPEGIPRRPWTGRFATGARGGRLRGRRWLDGQIHRGLRGRRHYLHMFSFEVVWVRSPPPANARGTSHVTSSTWARRTWHVARDTPSPPPRSL